ncbi:MAG: hypothetical protein KU37_07620 [Sulfuricurvum sp. PC08-66]|nr:MAG: hypothetical protein KU37_07620 [Sulfuricurvum sp. PC08-66]
MRSFWAWVVLIVALWGNEVDNMAKIKSLEHTIEERIQNELNRFIALPTATSVTIATTTKRVEQQELSTVQQPTYLPGLYDLKLENIAFDAKTNSYYINQSTINRITVAVAIDTQATADDIAQVKRIAMEKGDLESARGDSVTVTKKAFVSRTKESTATPTPVVVKQEPTIITNPYDDSWIGKTFADVNKTIAALSLSLEEERQKRLSLLDKSDIAKLTQIDKKDIERLESLAKEEKERIASLQKTLYQQIEALREELKKSGTALKKELKASMEDQAIPSKLLDELKASQAYTEKAVAQLSKRIDGQMSQWAKEVNANFALYNERITQLQKMARNEANVSLEPVAATPMVIQASLNEERVVESIEKNRRAIAQIQAQADAKIAQVERAFRMWVVVLLVAFLSMAYIIYYFASNANARLRDELYDRL